MTCSSGSPPTFPQQLYAQTAACPSYQSVPRCSLHMAERHCLQCFCSPNIRVLSSPPPPRCGWCINTLGLLDTQRRALHIIGPQYCLSSLSHRRNVALSYIFKLLCLSVTSPLHSVLPALDIANTLYILVTWSRTRHQQSLPY